jgi:sugar phosphate permease
MMNGAQQIVGGLLAYCFSLLGKNRAITGYQAIFITYGVFSVFWGAFVVWYLPDSPMRAKCFSEDDKRLMVERVRTNQTGLQNKKFRKEQAIEALKDPQIWCYCLIQICTTLPTSGLGAFYNIIIKGLGFTTLQTQLLAMVLGAFIIAILMSSTWIVNKTKQNLITIGIYLIPSYVGTIVLMTVPNTSTATKAGLLISYYIVLSFWAAQGLGMSLLSRYANHPTPTSAPHSLTQPRNVAGQTKKSFAVSLNFIAWSVGNAVGKSSHPQNPQPPDPN